MQLVKTLIPILWFLIIALGHKVSGLGVLGTALTSNELDIDNHLCKAENIKVNEYFCSSGWQRITKSQSIWPNPKVFIFGLFISLGASRLNQLIVCQSCYSDTDYGGPERKLPSLNSQQSTLTGTCHSQILRYDQSIFCLPHRPKFSYFFDICLHWVSLVRVFRGPPYVLTWLNLERC